MGELTDKEGFENFKCGYLLSMQVQKNFGNSEPTSYYSDEELEKIYLERYKKEIIDKDAVDAIKELFNETPETEQIVFYILILLMSRPKLKGTISAFLPYFCEVLASNSNWKSWDFSNKEEKERHLEELEEQLIAKAEGNEQKSLQKSFQRGIPKTFTSPNTKLSQILQDKDIWGSSREDPFDLAVVDIGKPSQTVIQICAGLDNLDKFPIIGKPFTEFDRAVHDAVATLYMDRKGNGEETAFTTDMIYRAMVHKTGGEKVSDQQRKLVDDSLQKMRKNIFVVADCTEEFKRKGIVVNANGRTDKEKYGFIMDDFILSSTRVEVKKVGGQPVHVYFMRKPILLEYAELTKQYVTIDGDMLRIHEVDEKGSIKGSTISDGETRIAIKNYLARRYAVMRRDEKEAAEKYRKYSAKREKNKKLEEKKLSNFRNVQRVITFEDIFKKADITAANRQAEQKKYVYQVLDYWKAIGKIKAYKQRKKGKGKSIDAVIIEF